MEMSGCHRVRVLPVLYFSFVIFRHPKPGSSRYGVDKPIADDFSAKSKLSMNSSSLMGLVR